MCVYNYLLKYKDSIFEYDIIKHNFKKHDECNKSLTVIIYSHPSYLETPKFVS